MPSEWRSTTVTEEWSVYAWGKSLCHTRRGRRIRPLNSVLESYWILSSSHSNCSLAGFFFLSLTHLLSMPPMSSPKSLIKVINNSASILVSVSSQILHCRFRAQQFQPHCSALLKSSDLPYCFWLLHTHTHTPLSLDFTYSLFVSYWISRATCRRHSN